ncbi:S-layer homology domain-containing protein [Pseudoflavonifractor phocaeensis]|uniref:S-layer homology domain-containing protein n=1 Tax=Pseudoflavonifractor phocaeensis TaxID=1870988 RepID=UPI00210A05BD|nr:S-layer homology domain-containing protein [Pseudoflavonifractor phocaeensis]MCQ4864309.1 S-layer homology domain-containing protein [Pseudoflavonifractor phocaeensis]
MKKLRKALSVLACTALLCGMCMLPAAAAAGEAWGSDYDTSDTFIISTADELKQFAAMVSSGKDFDGKTITLVQDIALDPGEQWVPIGGVNGESTPTTVFAGTFDGGGRRITGMSITCMDDTDPAYSGMGLFDSVSGTVENLTVAEFQINATLDRAGGIAGILAAGGTIRSCTADGAITGGLYEGEYMGGYFGGIVGDNGGIMSGSKGGTISGCTASGTITGASSIGGIVGSTAGYFGSITISDCINYADVSVEYSHAGGIAGISSGTRLIDCRNAGNITYIGGNSEPTEFSRGSALGGITGAASNQVVEIRGCINEGAVAGTASVSGIVGACADNVTVSGCANYGPISGVVRDIGGIVGNNWAVIEACLNVGSVSGRDQTATGVGALAGHNVKIDGHFGTAKKCVYAYTEGTNPIGTDDGDLEGNPTDASLMGYQADGTLKEAVGGKTTLAEALSAVYPEGVPDVFKVTATFYNGEKQTVTMGSIITLPTASRAGYDFAGWKLEDTALSAGTEYLMLADTAFDAQWNVIYTPSTPSKPGTTVTNPDGSTTTTKTDSNGTVTETTKGPDGSTTVVETRKDGTVTEKQETADGVKSETVTRPDGSMTAKVETADGSKGTTSVTAGGETRAEATVTALAVETAAKADAPVVLPVAPVAAAKTSGAAPVVSVTLPSSAGAVAVKVPVAGVTAGTVAVLVHADGTEETVVKSTVDEDGVALTLDGSATIKIVDNSKAFADTAPVSGWAGDAIDFVTSRELFQGTGENTFSPLMTTDRAMIATVLWRLEGRQSAAGAAPADVPSDAWYADAMAWAVEQGIVNPDNGSVSPAAPVTREQLAAMLYRLSGAPAVSTSVSGQVSAWAADAMAWAVEQGLIQGDGASLNAGATATRAEVSAILMRYISL